MVSLRTKNALLPEIPPYCLVYWPDEESVTALKTNMIHSPVPSDLKVGDSCDVAICKKMHSGKLAAKGEFHLYVSVYVHVLHVHVCVHAIFPLLCRYQV